MRVSILRIGHRLVRDDRVTTHAALVARAFGAEKIYMTGIDESVSETITNVSKRWGNFNFSVQVVSDWKRIINNWKKEGGKIVHLTMYGINLDDNMVRDLIRRENNNRILIIIGAEKVPRQVYELADYNIAIGNQPHSEIAALAVFLDRIFRGEGIKKEFADGKLKIIPMERGKKVQESK